MAEVPRYGRRVAPAGPGPWSVPTGGSFYEQGLGAWSKSLGEVGAILKEKEARIKRASEAATVIGRSAQFSLDMDRLLLDTQKLPTAAERLKFFAENSEKLKDAALDSGDLSPEAKTDLLSTVTGQYTRRQVAFMQYQEARELKNIADQADFAWNTAVTTDDEPLAHKSADDLVRTGVITPAMREQRLAGFKTDARLSAIRQQMDMLDQSDIAADVKLQGLQSLMVQLEGLNQKDLTEDQKETLNRLLKVTREDQKAVEVARDKAQKELVEATGRAVYSDITTFDATQGKEGKSYSPAQLQDLYIGGALGKEQYDSILKIVTGDGSPDPLSALQAEILITDVDSGYRTLENAIARQIELSPNLTADQRITFYKDLAKGRSSWRGHIRSKGEAAIDDAVSEVGPLGRIPAPEAVSTVAKKQFWDAVREAEGRQEVLAEEKFVPLAVDIALRTLREYKADKMGFNAKHGFTVSNPRVSMSTIDQNKKPQSLAELKANTLTFTDPAAAKAYFNRWIEQVE